MRKLVALLGLLLLLPVLAVSQPQWHIIGHTSFTAGQGQAVGTDGQRLYIIRQYGSQNIPTFVAYDVTPTKAGSPTPLLVNDPDLLSCPGKAIQSGVAIAADRNPSRDEVATSLYVLAGRYNKTRTKPTPVRKCFFRYDIASGDWQRLADTPYEQGSGDALTYVEWEGKAYLYAFVGSQCEDTDRPPDQPTIAFLRYDIEGNSWTELPHPAQWRAVDDGASLAWDGGRYVYALHGSNCSDKPTKGFARFDLLTQTWEERPDIPELVNDGGSLVWDGGNFLYAVVGGSQTSAYRYDLTAQQWQPLPDMPCPVGAHTGNLLAHISGVLYAWQGNASSANCGGTAILSFY